MHRLFYYLFTAMGSDRLITLSAGLGPELYQRHLHQQNQRTQRDNRSRTHPLEVEYLEARGKAKNSLTELLRYNT